MLRAAKLGELLSKGTTRVTIENVPTLKSGVEFPSRCRGQKYKMEINFGRKIRSFRKTRTYYFDDWRINYELKLEKNEDFAGASSSSSPYHSQSGIGRILVEGTTGTKLLARNSEIGLRICSSLSQTL